MELQLLWKKLPTSPFKESISMRHFLQITLRYYLKMTNKMSNNNKMIYSATCSQKSENTILHLWQQGRNSFIFIRLRESSRISATGAISASIVFYFIKIYFVCSNKVFGQDSKLCWSVKNDQKK